MSEGNYFHLKYGLGIDQSAVMQRAGKNQIDFIQTSSGLCLRCDQDSQAVLKLLGLENNESATLTKIETSKLNEQTKDVQSFIKRVRLA